MCYSMNGKSSSETQFPDVVLVDICIEYFSNAWVASWKECGLIQEFGQNIDWEIVLHGKTTSKNI